MMKEKKTKQVKKATNKQITSGIILLIIMCMVFVLVYKAQLADQMDNAVSCTLMSEHKKNQTVTMSEGMSVWTEVFICMVPELRELSVECEAKKIDDDAILVMILSDADTGEEYYREEVSVSDTVPKGDAEKIKMKLKKPLKDSEGKRLLLSWELLNGGKSEIRLTANTKPGIVANYNGMQEDKRNVIYGIKYASCDSLKVMYGILCIVLLCLCAISYWFIIIQKMSIDRCYIPIALLLGLIFQSVIAVHGVPDEPWHIDTAYKYSNKLLFVEDTAIPGTIYKRQCDVEMGDMLANGVESNSYYQILYHTFEKPERCELVQVAYVDSSNLVPGITFWPMAAGISIGRVLGLSTLLTLQLGRVCNLIVFVLLTWYAIRTIPYGKNLLGMLGLLPIALQQGASASYDAMLNGIVFLFIALCLRLSVEEQRKKWEWILLIMLAVLTAIIKAGAYVPVLLLLFLLYQRHDTKEEQIRCRKKLFLVCLAGIVLMTVLVVRYMPTLVSLVGTSSATKAMGGKDLYSLSYLIKHPLNTVYLYWNTFMELGAQHMKGLMGGLLGWHDLKIHWIYTIILMVGTLLLVNVENDHYRGTKKQRIIMVLASSISIAIIMMSMLLGCTPFGKTHIISIQGRYYLPLAPMLFLLTSNRMVRVKQEQCGKIWMAMIVTEIMIVLNVITLI